jgi:hypothetical protein
MVNEIEELKERVLILENRVKAVLDKNTSLMGELSAFKMTLKDAKQSAPETVIMKPAYTSESEEILSKGKYLKKDGKLWYVLDINRVVIAGPWQSKVKLMHDLKITKTARMSTSVYRIIR